MKKCAFLLIFFLSALSAFSKTDRDKSGNIWGDCHSRDQMLILGLHSEQKRDATSQNFSKIGDLLSEFNFLIDDHKAEGENSKFYKELQDKYNKYGGVDFSKHKYTHRIMFHWGYDWGDPLGHDALEKAFFGIDTNLKKLNPEQKKLFKSFQNDIINEQRKREAKMTGEVANFFNAQDARNFNRSIGALIYYTHLLGDQMKHANSYSQEAVLPLSQIINKIETAVNDIPNESRSAKERKSFKSEWKTLKNSKTTGDSLAQEALRVLQTYLPPILEKSFKSTFKSAGLTFVYRAK